MSQIIFEYKYKIGQSVYHATPESDKGIIIDIRFSVLTQQITYVIAFGRREEDQIECYEHELTESKIF